MGDPRGLPGRVGLYANQKTINYQAEEIETCVSRLMSTSLSSSESA